MVKAYVEELAELMKQAASEQHRDVRLEIKHFFSGAAVYANGAICITLTPAGLALKLPEEHRTTLLQKHGATPLRYFPKAPLKKEYVVLPASIIDDRKALRSWIAESIDYAVRA
ncbi:MAG: TfoX/Sxy family protein [Chloroflexi bacterium]|nr:TfoX/Sxy family protein [Chloroflexota bacterium]